MEERELNSSLEWSSDRCLSNTTQLAFGFLLNHALRANIAVPCYEMLFYGRIIQMELFEILWPRFRL